MRHLVDDLRREVRLPDVVTRVVSLVPSLTEAVAVSAPGLLVGVTDWCTHPADLDASGVARVRGTKNPDVDRIVALRPDLVLANSEENREADVRTLAAQGIAVWVTDVRTLDGAFPALGPEGSLARMLAACGLDRPQWLVDAFTAWAAVRAPQPRRRAVIPIWRRPWMAVGSDTFTGAVLERLGIDNALGASPERYPRIDLASLPPHDVVVLPDEPYRFAADDGPEEFPGKPSVLVSGRLLTWYGPSLVEAARTLPGLVGSPSPG